MREIRERSLISRKRPGFETLVGICLRLLE